MNTVKHSSDSNSRPLPKKPFPFWNNSYLPVILLAILLGTILDLYFVKRNLYEFPIRPFPEFFSFNIMYTFVVLPIFVLLYLKMMEQINKWGKVVLSLLISFLMPVFERLAELCGLFSHSAEWNHLYSVLGYFTFLMVIYIFYRWLENKRT